MKTRKFLLFSVVILSMLMAACAPGPVATEAPAAEAPAAEAPAAPAAEAPAEPAAAEPVVINYWSLWNEGEPQAAVINTWIAGYTALHPNVTFKVTWAGREVLTKLQTALSAGEKVDLVDHEGPALRGGLTVNGLTMGMDQYLEQPAFDEDKPFKDVFIPGTLELLAADDGSIHVIPYEIITTGVLYDKAYIETELGLTKPATWAEFMTFLEATKAGGRAAIAQDAGIDFYNAIWYYTLSQRYQGKGALMAAATDKTGAAWDDPAVVEIIKRERELWDLGYIPAESAGYVWPAGQLELAVGNAAMELVGSWLPNELKDTTGPDFQWGSFNVPSVEGGKGDPKDMEAYLLGWAVMKDTPNADVVADFMRYAMTKENAQMICDDAVNMSSRTDTVAPAALADMWEMYKNAPGYFLPYDGINAYYAEYYKTIFLKNHNDAFLGLITPEEFAAKMKADTIAYWEGK